MRGKVITAVITGLTRAQYHLSPYDLSCADVAGTVDYVLTPNDISFLNDLGEQMSDFIERKARENGYASFPIGALYNDSKRGVRFDLDRYLNSATPYGKLIGLDGVHPNAKGQSVLARAAKQAIQRTYGRGNSTDD